MIMKWLSMSDVMRITGVSRYELEGAIRAGLLKYQIMNKRKKFTERDIELWQTSTHTDYSSGETSSTLTSRSYPKQAQEFSLEKVLAEHHNKKLSTIASNV